MVGINTQRDEGGDALRSDVWILGVRVFIVWVLVLM